MNHMTQERWLTRNNGITIQRKETLTRQVPQGERCALVCQVTELADSLSVIYRGSWKGRQGGSVCQRVRSDRGKTESPLEKIGREV